MLGFFDDGISIISGKQSHGHGHVKHLKLRRKSRSRSESRDRDRGREKHRHAEKRDKHEKHTIDAMSVVGSVLGVPHALEHGRHRREEEEEEEERGHREKHHGGRGFWPWSGLGRHRSGFFGFSRPSYYRRSSRHGFIHRSYRKVKHLLRNLSRYAQRHPFKVFMLVILPLLTTGALTALLARFGLRLPRSVERLLGMAGRVAGGGGTLGLVGEAVRLAGDMSGPGSVHMTRDRKLDRHGDLMWERSVVDSSEGGWGSGIFDMAKRFV